MGFWMTFNRYAQSQQIWKPFQWVFTSTFVVGLAGAYIYINYITKLLLLWCWCCPIVYFLCCFCRSLFAFLSFLFWPLNCLVCVNLPLLILPFRHLQAPLNSNNLMTLTRIDAMHISPTKISNKWQTRNWLYSYISEMDKTYASQKTNKTNVN